MNAREISGLLDQAIGRLDGYAEEQIAAGAKEPAVLGEAREYVEQAQEGLLITETSGPGELSVADIIIALGGLVSRYARLPQTHNVAVALRRVTGAISELARMPIPSSMPDAEGPALADEETQEAEG